MKMGALFAKMPVVKFDWTKNMMGKDKKLESLKELDTVTGPAYYTCSGVFSVVLVVVTVLRSTELFSLFADSIMFLVMFIFLFVATASLFFKPPRNLSKLSRRVTVPLLIALALKREIDWDLANGLVSFSADDGGLYDLRDRVVVITGANSGVGLGATELFASYGATVVMACRSADRCAAAKQTVLTNLASRTAHVGPLVPELLDLSDLDSVQAFSHRMKAAYKHVDVLVNNAGSVPLPGARTAQGFEMSWGSMHLGHFALTQVRV